MTRSERRRLRWIGNAESRKAELFEEECRTQAEAYRQAKIAADRQAASERRLAEAKQWAFQQACLLEAAEQKRREEAEERARAEAQAEELRQVAAAEQRRREEEERRTRAEAQAEELKQLEAAEEEEERRARAKAAAEEYRQREAAIQAREQQEEWDGRRRREKELEEERLALEKHKREYRKSDARRQFMEEQRREMVQRVRRQFRNEGPGPWWAEARETLLRKIEELDPNWDQENFNLVKESITLKIRACMRRDEQQSVGTTSYYYSDSVPTRHSSDYDTLGSSRSSQVDGQPTPTTPDDGSKWIQQNASHQQSLQEGAAGDQAAKQTGPTSYNQTKSV